LSLLARLAGTPVGSLNRLVVNSKADGTGTDVIELRKDGNALFGPLVTAKGTSAQFQIVPTGGNGHVYWMAADGVTARMIMYTSGGAQGNGIVQLGNGVVFQFGADGNLYAHGGAYLQNTTGNIVGTVWNSWGAGDAYTAINARIESRAQAWANAVGSNCVQSMRVAGLVAADMNALNEFISNSGYFITMLQKMDSDSYRAQSRMLQMYIPSQGWLQATAW